MSDLVGNPEDRFSQNEAHICVQFYNPGISASIPLQFVLGEILVKSEGLSP